MSTAYKKNFKKCIISLDYLFAAVRKHFSPKRSIPYIHFSQLILVVNKGGISVVNFKSRVE